MNTESSFLFLLGSARVGGNSEALARRAAQGLPPAAAQTWLRLPESPQPPFHDRRHSPQGFAIDETRAAPHLLEATLGATDLVFVSPVYWYALPSATKLYLDRWTAWLRAPDVRFKARMAGRRLWVVTTFSDEDTSVATPLVESLRLTARYMDMRFGGVLAARANRPGDVLLDGQALMQADAFFARGPAAQVSPLTQPGSSAIEASSAKRG